jgi:DNA mismatch endonuclease (patch repair protein)
LPGKPDIALTKYRIAIFCDGEFFHGKEWSSQKQRVLKSNNSDYWISKIEKNMERDLENEKDLRAMEWTVIRFWSRDIIYNLDECIKTVDEFVQLSKYN